MNDNKGNNKFKLNVFDKLNMVLVISAAIMALIAMINYVF